jgi:hypothetical protein
VWPEGFSPEGIKVMHPEEFTGKRVRVNERRQCSVASVTMYADPAVV